MKTHDKEESLLTRFNIAQVYYLLFKHWAPICVCTLIGVVAAAVIYIRTPTVFRSEASLLVRYVAESRAGDPGAVGERVLAPGRATDILNTERAILTSLDLTRRVASAVGPRRVLDAAVQPKDLEDIQEKIMDLVGMSSQNAEEPLGDDAAVNMAAGTILRGLHVSTPGQSSILGLSFDSSDPALSQQVLQQLISMYMTRHFEIHRSSTAFGFLSQQTDELRLRLAETEEELQRIRRDSGIVSVETSRRELAERISRLQNALRETENALTVYSMTGKLPVSTDSLLLSGITDSAGSKDAPTSGRAAKADILARLRQREAQLLLTYTEDSPMVSAVREQIRRVQTESSVAAPTVPPADAKNVLEILRQRAEFYRGQLEQEWNEAARIDEAEARLAQLERKKARDTANYDYFSQSLEKARINDALGAGNIQNITVAQAATFPTYRIRPNLKRNSALAVALGFAAGLMLAFFRENILDRSLKRPTEAEQVLRLPVLISMPSTSMKKLLPSRGTRSNLLLAAKTGAGSPQEKKTEWSVRQDLKEYFETLRDSIVKAASASGRRPYILGVTSTHEGAGVTTIAAGLSVTLARDDEEQVLLADANLNGGQAHRMFGLRPSSGMVDVLSDSDTNEAVLQRNLYMIPAGKRDPHAGDVNVSRRFHAFMQSLRNSDYEFVVLDMPPMTETSLTRRMASLLDGIVLVLEAQQSDRDHALFAKHLLEREQAHLLGVVFNKKRDYIPHFLRVSY